MVSKVSINPLNISSHLRYATWVHPNTVVFMCEHSTLQQLTSYLQKYLKYISNSDLSRTNMSRIFQLRVGHVMLNQYLHRFKKVDNPHCPACGHPKETVEHFLLYCPKYAHEHWPILNQNQGSTLKLKKILTSSKLLIPLANYLDAMGRFQTMTMNPTVSNTTCEENILCLLKYFITL